ncbi:conserved hypothetical protein, secreted [Candidatus Magnetomorum sp. HK-1]|nr:conserved hypothetical protein, secreted [Candidatus Magnetomorum sp. HK-1]
MKKLMSIFFVTMVILLSNAWAEQHAVQSEKIDKHHNYAILPYEKQTYLIQNELDEYDILYKGQTIFPAIFAYHCNNHDPYVQNCGAPTIPYGNNLYTDIHFTHSWLQIMNTSEHTFNNENSHLFVKVFGKDGELAKINGSPSWYKDGIIDILHHELAGSDGFKPNESVFFYFGDWMNDKPNDKNPPYSAKLIVETKASSVMKNAITLSLHAGWEEIIEDNDGQRFGKGGTLIDKEIVQIKPVILEPSTQMKTASDFDNDGIKDYWDPDDDNNN